MILGLRSSRQGGQSVLICLPGSWLSALQHSDLSLVVSVSGRLTLVGLASKVEHSMVASILWEALIKSSGRLLRVVRAGKLAKGPPPATFWAALTPRVLINLERQAISLKVQRGLLSFAGVALAASSRHFRRFRSGPGCGNQWVCRWRHPPSYLTRRGCLWCGP